MLRRLLLVLSAFALLGAVTGCGSKERGYTSVSSRGGVEKINKESRK